MNDVYTMLYKGSDIDETIRIIKEEYPLLETKIDIIDSLFVSTNTGNNYSISTGKNLSELTEGMLFKVKINADSDGNTALNIDNNGLIDILRIDGTNVDNLKNNGVYIFIYDGTNFISNVNYDIVDEDDMVSNSDKKLPTQQSVKAFVTTKIAEVLASEMSYIGGYNADTNVPDLDTSPSGISKGDIYTVTVAGTFFTTGVEVGDVLISEKLNPTLESDWTIVNKNMDNDSILAIFKDNYVSFDSFLTNSRYKVTEFDTPTAGDITETIKENSDDSVYATRVTEFDTPTTGDITETITCSALSVNNTFITNFDTPTTGDITKTGGTV